MRLVNLYRGSFSYCFIFYCYWSKKKKTISLDRTLPYRGSTIRYIFIRFKLYLCWNKPRIFQHLFFLLVCFDPISLMRSKAQNAYKTALSPRLLRFQTGQGYVAFATMRNRLFFGEGSPLNLKTTPPTTFFLKRIISADDVVSDAFRWHNRQNKGVTGTYSVIPWSANFYWWILHVHSGSAGERYFRQHDSAQQWLKKGSLS